MKRLLSILLIFCLLLAVGCSSGDESSAPGVSGEESAGEESRSASSAESGESKPQGGSESSKPGEESRGGEESASPVEPTGDERVKEIDSLLDLSAKRAGGTKNVLHGLKYKASASASSDYPDDGKKLTDGESPTSFDKTSWVGYNKPGKSVKLDFDLGRTVDGILDFRTDVLDMKSYGIAISAGVTYYVAGEDGVYKSVGKVYPPSDMGEHDCYDFPLCLQGGVSARYIRVEIEDGTSAWLFVGEVSAFIYDEKIDPNQDENVVTSEEYYGFTEVPKVTEDVFWSESDSDYNSKINLVAGRQAMVFSGATISEELATEWYNTRNYGKLTDGAKASKAVYSDTAWMHFTRAFSRDLVYDLTRVSALSDFKVNFLRDDQPGVHLPRYVRIAVSMNGEDWETVYNLKSPTLDASSGILTLSGNIGRKARFVRLSFVVDVHAYVDEFEVFGTKNASGAKAPVPDAPDNKDSLNGSYILPEDFGNIHNILLSYHCRPDGKNHSESGLITKDEYLPYVAYLDREGNISDTMFDAFLYLPYTSFNYSDNARNFEGWKFYVDDIYYPGRNMAALNECVGDVKKVMRNDDYTVSVFTSILYTFRKDSSGNRANVFGDLDGDGVNEDFSDIKDRKKAIKWLMDEEYNRFKAGNYGNLRFAGFYWFEESIQYNDSHETSLIKFASDYAHQLGTKLIWIPYHEASGFNDWKELGFDLACMQPNYMFNATATSSVLYSNAEMTRLLGMCVEMEISDPTNRNNASRYTEYMIAGAKTGYMNAVKAYYQDGVPGAFYTACYSKDEDTRALYDNTYLYAKEKFTVPDEEDITLPDGGKISLTVDKGVNAEGRIDLGELSKYAEALTVSLSPKYGSLRLNRSGAFVYYPAEGFTGTDSFKVCIDLGYVRGAETEITVTVK